MTVSSRNIKHTNVAVLIITSILKIHRIFERELMLDSLQVLVQMQQIWQQQSTIILGTNIYNVDQKF